MKTETMARGEFHIVNIARELRRFSVIEDIINRKDWVKYKTIPNWHHAVIDENIVKGIPSEQFCKVTEQLVNSYIFNEEQPPAEVATAVINLADDYINGREPVLRTGDYISLQNYVRSHN